MNRIINIHRRGKIARLPREIRREINLRLDDGEPGPRLLAWLNGLPEVQAVLAEQFGGRPVSERNLSEWRQGGYADWTLQQETLEVAQRLRDEAVDLTAPGEDENGEEVEAPPPLTDTLALWLTARYAMATRRIAEMDEVEGWKLLREMCHDVIELRRTDQHARRLALEEDQRNLEWEQQHKKTEKEHMEWAMQPGKLEKLNRRETDQKEFIDDVRFRMWGPVPEDLYDGADEGMVRRSKVYWAEYHAKQARLKARVVDVPAPDAGADASATDAPASNDTGKTPRKRKKTPEQPPNAPE